MDRTPQTLPPSAIAHARKMMAVVAKAESPWDAAAKLTEVRNDYRPEGEALEPGVVFFVLALEALGLKTNFSCEGHPHGFYVSFRASHEMARRIHFPGYFHLQMEGGHIEWIEGGNEWSVRLPEITHDGSAFSERHRKSVLRHAAKAWVEKLWLPLGGPTAEEKAIHGFRKGI